MKLLFTLLQYWMSGEDSRWGRQEYWNHVFLEKKTMVPRFLWELSKTVFLIVLSFYIYIGFTRIVL